MIVNGTKDPVAAWEAFLRIRFFSASDLMILFFENRKAPLQGSVVRIQSRSTQSGISIRLKKQWFDWVTVGMFTVSLRGR
jgi:hypothetical protein